MKLDLENISKEVLGLFEKAMNSQSAQNLIGKVFDLNLQETLEVEIKGNVALAIKATDENGTEVPFWPSWLTRKGIDEQDGSVHSNTINGKTLPIEQMLSLLVDNKLKLETVTYFTVVEPNFQKSGNEWKRLPEDKVIKRAFYSWVTIPKI